MSIKKLTVLLLTCCFSSLSTGLELKAGIISTGGKSIGYNGKFIGEFSQLRDPLNCIFYERNIKASITEYPVSRLEKMLRDGELDIALPFSKTDERDQFAEHLAPIVEIKYFLLSNKELKDLPTSQLKIGAIIGSADLAIATQKGDG